MWMRENRGLYERKGVRYPSDLRDQGWALIAPLIPPAKRGGRRRLRGPAPQPFGQLLVFRL